MVCSLEATAGNADSSAWTLIPGVFAPEARRHCKHRNNSRTRNHARTQWASASEVTGARHSSRVTKDLRIQHHAGCLGGSHPVEPSKQSETIGCNKFEIYANPTALNVAGNVATLVTYCKLMTRTSSHDFPSQSFAFNPASMSFKNITLRGLDFNGLISTGTDLLQIGAFRK